VRVKSTPGKPAARHQPSASRLTVAGLAGLTANVAPAVLRGVLDSGKRIDATLAEVLRDHPRLSRNDRRLIGRSLSALLRWWGWIEPLRLVHIEDQLALAWLLDSSEIEAICRVWASKRGRSTDRIMAVGDAPNWTARAEGLKRWTEDRAVNADPWRLFPDWLRDVLPVPPGDASAKIRRLSLLQSLQTRCPLWVGVRGGPEKVVWNELREAGLKPWVHRQLVSAARLDADANLAQVDSFREGRLVIEDLASQALARVCDPEPGERWWDVNGGAGLHALHLGALMQGKGTVITTFDHERHRREATVRLRRGAFRNIAGKVWDGRRPPGKPGSFDGVLVDARSSGIGTWRRHPEARWTVSKSDLPQLAEQQKHLLDIASTAVRPGGTLVYTVATATIPETTEVVSSFLAAHPNFRLEPFPHPLEEDERTSGTLQLWPHLHNCEARYIARMVRRPEAPSKTEGKERP
jgi:16S rRNA (cytosine967-C5)-methyltransferase